SRSRRKTPGTFMASTIASTLALSRPSEKLGTHSTSVDICEKHKGRIEAPQALVTALLVHLRQQRLTINQAPQVFGNECVMSLPEALGDAGRMRRDDHVVKIPEWRVGRQRLRGEDVECRTADFVLSQH